MAVYLRPRAENQSARNSSCPGLTARRFKQGILFSPNRYLILIEIKGNTGVLQLQLFYGILQAPFDLVKIEHPRPKTERGADESERPSCPGFKMVVKIIIVVFYFFFSQKRQLYEFVRPTFFDNSNTRPCTIVLNNLIIVLPRWYASMYKLNTLFKILPFQINIKPQDYTNLQVLPCWSQ